MIRQLATSIGQYDARFMLSVKKCCSISLTTDVLQVLARCASNFSLAVWVIFMAVVTSTWCFWIKRAWFCSRRSLTLWSYVLQHGRNRGGECKTQYVHGQRSHLLWCDSQRRVRHYLHIDWSTLTVIMSWRDCLIQFLFAYSGSNPSTRAFSLPYFLTYRD